MPLQVAQLGSFISRPELPVGDPLIAAIGGTCGFQIQNPIRSLPKVVSQEIRLIPFCGTKAPGLEPTIDGRRHHLLESRMGHA